MSRPLPDNRLIVGNGEVAHYPWPPGTPNAEEFPLSPLCGETDLPVRSVPTPLGRQLCGARRNKGEKWFGW